MQLPVKHPAYRPEMELLCSIPPAPAYAERMDLEEIFLGRPESPAIQSMLMTLRNHGHGINARKGQLSIPARSWPTVKRACNRYWETTRRI